MNQHIHEHLLSIEAKLDLLIAMQKGENAKEINEVIKRLNDQAAQFKQANKDVSATTKGE